MALTVVGVGHGARDTWCRAAAGKVPVRSSATIGMAGSNSSGTSLEVTYRLQNGDQIRFEAGVDGEAIDRVVGSSLVPVDRGHAGCSFVREVRSRRRYECEAELKLDALTKHAVVVFTVAKAPKSPAVRSPQFCGSSSEIYGFTINNTDQPITEEEIGHGVTNSWCKLVSTDPVPPHSQNDWKIGDDSIFATSVDLTYSIPAPPPPPPRPSPGPDGFVFHAHTPILGSGGGASCEDEQSIYPNSGAFKCLTSYTEGFDRSHPSVDFVIAPSS